MLPGEWSPQWNTLREKSILTDQVVSCQRRKQDSADSFTALSKKTVCVSPSSVILCHGNTLCLCNEHVDWLPIRLRNYLNYPAPLSSTLHYVSARKSYKCPRNVQKYIIKFCFSINNMNANSRFHQMFISDNSLSSNIERNRIRWLTILLSAPQVGNLLMECAQWICPGNLPRESAQAICLVFFFYNAYEWLKAWRSLVLPMTWFLMTLNSLPKREESFSEFLQTKFVVELWTEDVSLTSAVIHLYHIPLRTLGQP